MKKRISLISIGIILLMCSVSFGAVGDDDQTIQPKIDLVFVIDTTGSMSDEIREVKMHIKNVIDTVLSGTPKPDVMIGFVIYRDYPDEEREYIYKIYSLTNDIDAVLTYLEEIEASGGGDNEETVTIGLDVAINEMNWRVTTVNNTDGEIIGYDANQNPIYASSGAISRMMFLIGDAPPRTREYVSINQSSRRLPSYKENIEDAKTKGITIYTVSGSGMDDSGIAIWKEIASETGGKYELLTYERQNIQTYVTEEKLDDHWVEDAKGMSDYDPSDGSILTNSLGDFMRSAVISEAQSLGVHYRNETTSEQALVYFTDVGYLLDTDNNTLFDLFHSNATGINTTVAVDTDQYFIDLDNDGSWEYMYTTAEGFVHYQEPASTFPLSTVALIVVIGAIVATMVLLIKMRFSQKK
ncbi:MAG: vWA domain-containing protein [Methanobacteriota archaeon]